MNFSHVLCLSLSLTFACADSGDIAPENQPTEPTAAKASGTQQSWRSRVDATVADLKSAQPDGHQRLMTLAPLRTRKGTLRFVGAAVRSPGATAVFLQRLIEAPSSDMRAALVEALPRTGGVYADALAELGPSERDTHVRAMMAATLRHAPGPAAIAALATAMADEAPAVRVEALIAAGRRAEHATLASGIESALGATEATVQIAAVTAAHNLKLTSTVPAIANLASSDDARVRITVARALASIANHSTALTTLRNGSDSRVRKAAQ